VKPRPRELAALIATLWLAGCALLAPPQAPARRAMLEKVPADLPSAAPRPATVVVLPPQTLPVYDTTRMAYSSRPHEVAYFRDHEWAATPSQMVQPLLLRTLQSTRAFAAVLAPPDAGRAHYVLRTQIVELLQDFSADPPVVRVALQLQLSGGAAARRTSSAEVVVREPIGERTPQAGVAAANEAIAKALLQVARFVLEQTHDRRLADLNACAQPPILISASPLTGSCSRRR
jgi:cholesterol transport system auxiliary component